MSEEEEITGEANDGKEDDTEDNSDENDEEVVEEDPPEVKALKERIKELEATLSEKKSTLQYTLEQCEEHSKGGYARKVAEMENMKRIRSNIASTTKSSATAAVLRDFLPLYDKLNSLKEKYADDEFGSKYSELNLQQTFETLGVTSFSVSPGEKVNSFRMKVLDSEESADQPKDTVLRQVSTGLELQSNVIRPASCISSSGVPESVEEDGNEETENEQSDDAEDTESEESSE